MIYEPETGTGSLPETYNMRILIVKCGMYTGVVSCSVV